MSSVECLREFVNERLTAAAEEIFGVFQKTIVAYEEEIYRQRKLLDIVWKPEVKLHRIDLQQQHVCEEKEEEVLTDQQLCNQERSSSLDQEDPEPVQIKEEQEEPCTSQEGEELVVKVEADTFGSQDQKGHRNEDSTTEISGVLKKSIVEYEDKIYRQHKLLGIVWKPEVKLHRIDLKRQHVCEEEEEEVLTDQQLCNQERSSSLDQEDPEPVQIEEEHEEPCTSQEGEELVLNVEADTFVVTPTDEERDHSKAEPERDHQLLLNNFYAAESQDQEGHKNEDSTRDAETEQNNQQHENSSHSNIVNNPDSNIHKPSFKCNTCVKDFKYKSSLLKHIIVHTGEKPCLCKTCGKRFSRTDSLKMHQKVHTGEKPYICTTCGRAFRHSSTLKAHIRCVHNRERLYQCKICGKRLSNVSALKTHQGVHTGEKPYICTTCGRTFTLGSSLKLHIRRVHIGEKQYLCNTCGKRFGSMSYLRAHQRIHTGEKPYICSTCGKAFRQGSNLNVHIRRVHNGERPYTATCQNPYRLIAGHSQIM